MKPNPTIQEQAEAFRQRLKASEYRHQQFIAAMAVGQAVQHLRQTSPSPRLRWGLRSPRRMMGQMFRWLIGFCLRIFQRKRRRGETREWGFSSSKRQIIIDVSSESIDQGPPLIRDHTMWSVANPQEIQLSDEAFRWLHLEDNSARRERNPNHE